MDFKGGLVVVGLFFLSACLGTSKFEAQILKEDSSTEVVTSVGSVVGGRSRNGAKTWLGIPFAAPPQGELRWRAPVDHSGWSGVKAALEHANWCPQRTNGLDALSGIEAGQVLGSEDCLYLDVYAPSAAESGSNLPVMVWVHGGSNVWGRAEQYDGSVLAEGQNVVVIVIQYRLGALGYFAHPSVMHQNEGSNFALLDVIKALEWVGENAHAFGGDARRVTMFGESAGGNNILALLSMPDADGLYHRAIVQSSLPGSTSLDWALNGSSKNMLGALETAKKITGDANASGEVLRGAAAHQIIDAYAGAQTPTVIADGMSLSKGRLQDAIADNLADKAIPIILGANRDEAKYLLAFDDGFTKKAIGLFPQARDRQHYDATSDYLSKLWFDIGVDQFAQTLREANTGPVFTYRFDWDEQGRTGLSDIGHLIGAAHSIEIPFVFGRFEEFMGRLDKRMFHPKNSQGRAALSEAMMSYWADFAYDRILNGENNLVWTEGGFLVFDASKSELALRLEELHSDLPELLAAIAHDKRLEKAGRRCQVAEFAELVFSELDQRLNELSSEYC